MSEGLKEVPIITEVEILIDEFKSEFPDLWNNTIGPRLESFRTQLIVFLYQHKSNIELAKDIIRTLIQVEAGNIDPEIAIQKLDSFLPDLEKRVELMTVFFPKFDEELQKHLKQIRDWGEITERELPSLAITMLSHMHEGFREELEQTLNGKPLFIGKLMNWLRSFGRDLNRQKFKELVDVVEYLSAQEMTLKNLVGVSPNLLNDLRTTINEYSAHGLFSRIDVLVESYGNDSHVLN